MRLNLEFKESTNHAWLINGLTVELFVRRPLEALTLVQGSLAVQVPSSQMDEIREDEESDTPHDVWVCCATDKDTKLYEVIESVTYAGGDALLFLKPVATFH